MNEFPSIPRLETDPVDRFGRSHLWIQEKVDGANFRFQLQRSGVLRFGSRSRVYDTEEIPAPYRHAVRHVRERIDRDALRSAVEDVEAVVFFGEAMHRHAIDYDWDRTPSFLGFDIWNGTAGRYLPPDTVEKVYRRLGLTPINTIRKEVRAVDFDPDTYEIPSSNWYDGPAEGVIVRDKTGIRSKLLHPDVREVDETVPVDAPVPELAQRYATDRRFEKLATKLEDRERAVTVDRLSERAFEDIVREKHTQLCHGDRSVDMRAFRSDVASVASQFVAKRR
ncbi:RNA ligase family protein [Natronoglomus mannanivorans]|uniref:RNA ligase family protein n=1 Tax=Natronoglomus mannanivorans TaxID=2979990 RepID=A0AAP2YWI0_9EURY|nr:RNA ligase family protein [Halobacteria archaeon AArc-xg1-1]